MSDMSLDWLNYGKIVEIVEIASQIILQIYLNDELFMNMNMTIENKIDAGNSPLTIADKKANDFICRELRGLYPDIPIISEENKNDDWEVRRKYTWVWLVDPLDGTKEFIKRNGEFTVNIGLVYMGEPVAGFVGVPAQGLIYWGGVGGAGAWKRKIGDGKTIDLIEENTLIKKGNITRIVASRSHMDDKTDQFIKKNYVEKGRKVELLNVGSSLKILWIAENKADVYPRLAPTMEWDTCAAHAILRACGGTLEMPDNNSLSYLDSSGLGASQVQHNVSGLGVSQVQHNVSGLGVSPFLKGAELTYNKNDLLNPNFICRIKSQSERKHHSGHLAE
jgi:3'(2'), 5'-bisphosphate nucleotidase